MQCKCIQHCNKFGRFYHRRRRCAPLYSLKFKRIFKWKHTPHIQSIRKWQNEWKNKNYPKKRHTEKSMSIASTKKKSTRANFNNGKKYIFLVVKFFLFAFFSSEPKKCCCGCCCRCCSVNLNRNTEAINRRQTHKYTHTHLYIFIFEHVRNNHEFMKNRKSVVGIFNSKSYLIWFRFCVCRLSIPARIMCCNFQ